MAFFTSNSNSKTYKISLSDNLSGISQAVCRSNDVLLCLRLTCLLGYIVLIFLWSIIPEIRVMIQQRVRKKKRPDLMFILSTVSQKSWD